MPERIDLFVKNPVTHDVQEALFGTTPCLYTSLFYERGSMQDIHRDAPYFSTNPENFYLGMWVALEDSSVENGALNVIRGGYRIPEPDRTAIVLKHFPTLAAIPSSSTALWDSYQGEIQRLCAKEGLQKTSLCVEAGHTVIWHPLLPHGGGEIQNFAKSRFSFVMHTTPVGVPVYHHDKFFNPAACGHGYLLGLRQQGRGRFYVERAQVDFAHQEIFPANTFKQPS